MKTGRASLVVLCVAVFAIPRAARADIVVFKTGRNMSIQSYRVDGGRATLVLREGGEVECAATLIDRVETDEVPYLVAGADPAGVRPAEFVGTSGRVSGSGPTDEVLAARPFADLISAVATRQGMEPRLVHAVIEAESNYQTRARSSKGAKGLMQLMPATARQYAVRNPYDPQTNIEAGVRHLKDLMTRFDLSLALAAYNAGEGTVRRYGGLPPFPETQTYVRRVLQTASR